MFYDYNCTNVQCPNHYNVVTVQKPMSESSAEEHCSICGCKLTRTLESLVSPYSNTTGFFGKAGQHD